MIGEFGDVLMSGGNFEDENKAIEVSDSAIVRLLQSILMGPYANQLTREYVLTALMKLSSRLTDPAVQETIKAILQQHTVSMEVEIQQRAVEYTKLFAFDNIRPAVLERMPVPEARPMIGTNANGPSSPGESIQVAIICELSLIIIIISI